MEWLWHSLLHSKTCVKRPLSKRPKLVFNTNYLFMQVKSIAECSNGSILQYFRPLLSYHLSFRSLFCLFSKWSCYTGFTVFPCFVYVRWKDDATNYSRIKWNAPRETMLSNSLSKNHASKYSGNLTMIIYLRSWSLLFSWFRWGAGGKWTTL